jgi:hypothetical protein
MAAAVVVAMSQVYLRAKRGRHTVLFFLWKSSQIFGGMTLPSSCQSRFNGT